MNSDLLPVFFCNGAADPKLWALILLSSVRWKNHLAAIQLCHSLTKPRKGDWHNGEIFIMVFFPAVIFLMARICIEIILSQKRVNMCKTKKKKIPCINPAGNPSFFYIERVWINHYLTNFTLNDPRYEIASTVSRKTSVRASLLCKCDSKCLNTYEGAAAQLVCINRPCVRHEGRVVICLTANLQRSGEWDQTGGKITPHTPKWETIIPPKVTQTQLRIRIIEQAFCSSFSLSFSSSSSSSSSSSPQGVWRKKNEKPLFIYICYSSSSFSFIYCSVFEDDHHQAGKYIFSLGSSRAHI